MIYFTGAGGYKTSETLLGIETESTTAKRMANSLLLQNL
jgi:hypothetical protein